MPKLNEDEATGEPESKVTELFPDGEEPTDPPKPKKSTAKKTTAKKSTTKAAAKKSGGKPSKPRKPPKRDVAPPATTVKEFKPDLSKLEPLEEQDDFLRVVLYGDGGVGKTTSMATLANQGKLVVVDPEGSVRKRALARQGIDTSNIAMWNDWTYDGLEQLYVTAKEQLEKEPGSIFAIGIDTVTALAQFWLEADVKMALESPAMKKKHPNRSQFDVFQDDYGVLAEQVKTVITRRLFLLPCHVVVTAHIRRGENEEGQIRVGPALSPAAQQGLITYSDWVFRLSRAEIGRGDDKREVRTLDTRPRGNIEAKDRFGLFDSQITDRTLEDLYLEWEKADG